MNKFKIGDKVYYQENRPYFTINYGVIIATKSDMFYVDFLCNKDNKSSVSFLKQEDLLTKEDAIEIIKKEQEKKLKKYITAKEEYTAELKKYIEEKADNGLVKFIEKLKSEIKTNINNLKNFEIDSQDFNNQLKSIAEKTKCIRRREDKKIQDLKMNINIYNNAIKNNEKQTEAYIDRL